MAGRPLSNPNAVHPDCMLCADTGIQHLPDYPPCYRFCACGKGVARKILEPFVVDEANDRELMLASGGLGRDHAAPSQGGRR